MHVAHLCYELVLSDDVRQNAVEQLLVLRSPQLFYCALMLPSCVFVCVCVCTCVCVCVLFLHLLNILVNNSVVLIPRGSNFLCVLFCVKLVCTISCWLNCI